MPERPKGADCKSAGIAFGGSNPPRPTLKYLSYFGLSNLKSKKLLAKFEKMSHPVTNISYIQIGKNNKRMIKNIYKHE